MTNAYALQEAASRSAEQVDAVFIFIAAVSLFFFLLVEGLLIAFAVKYRRRTGAEAAATSDVRSNVLLETVWIIVPSLVVLAFFAYGALVFRDLRTPLAGASDINVVARQFAFEFRYPDGRRTLNELRVAEGRPVKLVMTSEDVIHSFYIPAYRIKEDVVPGRYTYLWLSPDKPGSYDVFCAEYCGVGHSTMRAALIVMPGKEFAAWEAGAGREEAAAPTAVRGKALVESSGCLGCHAVEGPEKIGPNFKGIFGRRTTLADGRSVTVDEEYIRESLMEPGAKVVKGYPAAMPTFKGILTDADIRAIVAWLKTV